MYSPYRHDKWETLRLFSDVGRALAEPQVSNIDTFHCIVFLQPSHGKENHAATNFNFLVFRKEIEAHDMICLRVNSFQMQ
jgi:hypothetical protein